MTRYVWKNGGFIDPATGDAMPLPHAGEVCTPAVIGDIPAYRSPITGEWVDGRRARREDLKKNNCVEAGDMPLRNGGRVKDAAFARKHGLRHEGD